MYCFVWRAPYSLAFLAIKAGFIYEIMVRHEDTEKIFVIRVIQFIFDDVRLFKKCLACFIPVRVMMKTMTPLNGL